MEITLENKDSLIKQFIANKEQKAQVYERQDKLIQELLKIEEPLIIKNNDGTWTRITITDNADNLDNGFYTPARVSRYAPKVDVPKNMPKELKETVA